MCMGHNSHKQLAPGLEHLVECAKHVHIQLCYVSQIMIPASGQLSELLLKRLRGTSHSLSPHNL